MPQKTFFVKDADVAIYDEAERRAKSRNESMSQFAAYALKVALSKRGRQYEKGYQDGLLEASEILRNMASQPKKEAEE